MKINYSNTESTQIAGLAASLVTGSAAIFGVSSPKERLQYLKNCSSNNYAAENIQNFSKALFGTTHFKVRAALLATSALLGAATYASTFTNAENADVSLIDYVKPKTETTFADNLFCDPSNATFPHFSNNSNAIPMRSELASSHITSVSNNLLSNASDPFIPSTENTNIRRKGEIFEITMIIGGVARKARFKLIPPPLGRSKHIEAEFVNDGTDLKDIFPGVSNFRIPGNSLL